MRIEAPAINGSTDEKPLRRSVSAPSITGTPTLYIQNCTAATRPSLMEGCIAPISPNSAIDTHPNRLTWACTARSEWSPDAPIATPSSTPRAK
ncbi:hypothetical protein D3C81_1945910 [compost metagenome]